MTAERLTLAGDYLGSIYVYIQIHRSHNQSSKAERTSSVSRGGWSRIWNAAVDLGENSVRGFAALE